MSKNKLNAVSSRDKFVEEEDENSWDGIAVDDDSTSFNIDGGEYECNWDEETDECEIVDCISTFSAWKFDGTFW